MTSQIQQTEAPLRPSGPIIDEAAFAAAGLPAPGKMTIERHDQPGVVLESLDFDDAVKLAVQLHQANFLDAAATLYQRILDINPQHPAILQFSGVLLHQRGDSEAGIARIRRAIELDPEAIGFWNNLGNVLLTLKRFDEAAAAYQRCSELAPEDPGLLNNLGLLHRAQGRMEEADASYRRALALKPDFVEALNNYGNFLRESGRLREAVEHYCRATTVAPANPEMRRLVAMAHITLDEVDKAKALYRAWVKEEPDSPLAKHYLAAVSGEEVPVRASDAYVETTFDRFAASFDAKLEQLMYRAPGLVADEVARLIAQPAKDLDVLDAGCGTGLCGPLLAPYAKQLAGVDLSREMIQRARERNVYDELHKGELTAFLAANPHVYDLVVSADTLCYFGALEEVAGAAWQSLRPGGWLVFTVEQTGGIQHWDGERPDSARPGREEQAPEGHLLRPSGRWAHRLEYIQTTFKNAGFRDLEANDVHLRTEGGLPVEGLLVSCRKGGAACNENRS